MLAEFEDISSAIVDAVNYRVKELGEPLEGAVHAVEASLRGRGVDVTLHLSTVSPVRELSDNAAVYEVTA